MPINLGDQEWIVLVADADTPANLTPYTGRIVGVPAGVVLPTHGQLDSITVGAVTVHGYLRWSETGTVLEWVMAAPANPNVTAVNAIPPAGSWTSLPARQVYYSIGSALLGLGVPGVELRQGLKQLYDAATADMTAAVAAGRIPPPAGPTP